MKALYRATFVLLLLISLPWALTQSGSTSQQQPDKSQTTASAHKGQKSIDGCLSGAANTFTLTDATGKTYELLGDTSGLKENLGHKVRLWGEPSEAGGGTRISAAGPYVFGVKTVESLSDTCKQPSR